MIKKRNEKMSEMSLIMLAAGNSTRFNTKVKKQFLRLWKWPSLALCNKNLSSFYPFKKIVVTSSNITYMKNLLKTMKFIEGGDTRAESLKKALELIDSEFCYGKWCSKGIGK